MRTAVLLLLLLFAAISHLSAQPVYRSGTIVAKQVGNATTTHTLEATVYTYTQNDPEHGDSIKLCWGDGVCENLPRINGPGTPPRGELLSGNLKLSIYSGSHTYPERGTYVLSTSDCCWANDILNIELTDSTPFRLTTVYTFLNPLFFGTNSLPTFLQPNFTQGVLNRSFTHFPNAYDLDGDRLTYSFYDDPDSTYILPDQVSPGPDNVITIDSITGAIRWEKPQKAGAYSLPILVTEHRNDIPISRTMYPLLIEIEDKIFLTQDFEINTWQLFPNPANNQVTIRAGTLVQKPYELSLVDALGRVIIRKRKLTAQSHLLDLTGISAGMYCIIIHQRYRTETLPLIIY